MGIETLKKTIEAGANLVKALDKSLDDGKVTWFEVIGMIGELKDMKVIISQRKDISDEWKDLDSGEKIELETYFQEKFDLRDDQKEIFVEKCFNAVLALADAYESMSVIRSGEGDPGQGPVEPDPS